jgi:hypothetical protein
MVNNSSSATTIPLRLLVIALVAALAGGVVGGLTWIGADDVAGALIAGFMATAAVFAWLHQHVSA